MEGFLKGSIIKKERGVKRRWGSERAPEIAYRQEVRTAGRPSQVLDWLLEPQNPSVRYWALRDLVSLPQDSPQVAQARVAIMESAPVIAILDAQYPQGYWVSPGVGYSPKYRGTLWQILFLAQLGASPTPPVQRACEYGLENAYHPYMGLFSAHRSPSGAIFCLNGNLLWAYRHLGYGGHPRIVAATEALADQMIRQSCCCRHNAAHPERRETWLPCAWGATKALLAFSLIPEGERSEKVNHAIEVGVDLLLGHDLSKADYPSPEGISPLWFQLGFPLGFTSDILESLEALAAVGKGDDPRLAGAKAHLLARRDEAGRWPLDRTLSKTWARLENPGQPSKWITLRALRALVNDPSFRRP